jgi:hypothetical protein
MKHTITKMPKGFITIKIHGAVSTDDAMEIGQTAIPLLMQLGDEGIEPRILLDYTHVGPMLDESCLNATKHTYAELPPTTRFALVAPPSTPDIDTYVDENNQAVQASGNNFSYKVFTNTKDAQEWLLATHAHESQT